MVNIQENYTGKHCWILVNGSKQIGVFFLNFQSAVNAFFIIFYYIIIIIFVICCVLQIIDVIFNITINHIIFFTYLIHMYSKNYIFQYCLSIYLIIIHHWKVFQIGNFSINTNTLDLVCIFLHQKHIKWWIIRFDKTFTLFCMFTYITICHFSKTYNSSHFLLYLSYVIKVYSISIHYDI